MKSATRPALRPPAIPLVCHDPYFSVWSCTDHLADGPTRHWTGRPHPLFGLLRVDGALFRFLGHGPQDEATAAQRSLAVHATRTVAVFEASGVRLTLTFLTPALPQDLDLLSRPVTYLIWSAASCDGRPHRVQLAFAAQASLAVNQDQDAVLSGRFRLPALSVLRTGAAEQKILARSGDDLRIEWGYLHLATPPDARCQDALTTAGDLRRVFRTTGHVPAGDDLRSAEAVRLNGPVLAASWNLGRIAPGRVSTCHALLAYDDLLSIEFLQRRLPAYWRRSGRSFADMLQQAENDLPRLELACARFDRRLSADLRRAGGDQYAELCILAYRQSLAAHKLVADVDGTPLFFSKENFSNGCIATVDVTYPSAPMYLWLCPALLEGMLKPVLDYARLPRWRFPFAPHDLGTYPLANGQVYGGGERTEENQMPVEECGNLLILVAAVARSRGEPSFARPYQHLLAQWARYLARHGFDPANQLCTDDFAGHLGRNTNLSIKAIVALGAYAQLAGALGQPAEQRRYRALARRLAKRWVRLAADGDHFRLTFDRPGTWSQKYNLVWDRLLGLDLFPAAVARKEVAHYLRMQTPLGLPLDSRKGYTKNDWILWSATLAEREADFRALVEPVWQWAHTTPTRVPLCDWYETADGRQAGFQARSVVGGFFLKMLADGRWRR
jgi:hypothetical protein